LVRDNSETFTAAEATATATVKKKKKLVTVVIQETSFQISVWMKSVSGMQEENMIYRYRKQKTETDHCVGAEEEKKMTYPTRNQLSDL